MPKCKRQFSLRLRRLRSSQYLIDVSSISCFYIAHVAMSPSCFAVPYLPFCLLPDQNALISFLPGSGGTLPPVGVSERLPTHPFPAAFALPVIQACRRIQLSISIRFFTNNIWVNKDNVPIQKGFLSPKSQSQSISPFDWTLTRLPWKLKQKKYIDVTK